MDSSLLRVISPVIPLHGGIMTKGYETVLQVHPMVQVLFIHRVSIFQDDNAHVHIGKWIHEQQEQVKCLSCPPESLHLKITEQLERN